MTLETYVGEAEGVQTFSVKPLKAGLFGPQAST